MTIFGTTIREFEVRCDFCGSTEGMWTLYCLKNHVEKCLDIDSAAAEKVTAKMVKKMIRKYAQDICESIDRE